MPALLLYLFKTIACSGILFLYYRLALHNRPIHQWNRFFLLGGVAISILLPMISIDINLTSAFYNTEEIQLLQVVKTYKLMNHEDINAPANTFSWYAIALITYIIITALLLALAVKEIHRLYKLAKLSNKEQLKDFTIVFTEEKDAPFSWFRNIFWNRKIDIRSSIGAKILHHELIHVRQYHSVDRLFMNIVAALLWINPFYWLIRKELTAVHEFIADEATAEKGDASLFSEMALACSFPGYRFHSTSFFNSSSIKRRILMLNKIRSTSTAYYARLLCIPVIVVLFAAFSLHTRSTPLPPAASAKKLKVVIDAGHGGTASGAVALDGSVEKDFTLALAKHVKRLNSFNDINIVLTRETDVLLGLQERVNLAVNEKADVFISLHLNGGNPEISGIDLIVSNKESSYSGQSQLLGSVISKELEKLYTVKSTIQKGRTGGGIWVLDAPTINYPSLLVECGNIDNQKDLDFIKSADNQEKVAKQLLQAIRIYADTNKK